MQCRQNAVKKQTTPPRSSIPELQMTCTNKNKQEERRAPKRTGQLGHAGCLVANQMMKIVLEISAIFGPSVFPCQALTCQFQKNRCLVPSGWGTHAPIEEPLARLRADRLVTCRVCCGWSLELSHTHTHTTTSASCQQPTTHLTPMGR